MSKKKSDFDFHAFMVGIWDFLKFLGNCLCFSIRALNEPIKKTTKINLVLAFVLIFVWSFTNTHLWLLNWKWPELVTTQFVYNVGMTNWWMRFGFLLFWYLLGLIVLFGLPSIRKMRSIEKAFKKAGLKNAIGEYPVVKDVVRLSPFRERIEIDTMGVPKDTFEEKRGHIRACVNSQVEGVFEQDEPKYVDLYLSKKPLPTKVSYSSVCGNANKPGDFVVGSTHGKVITQNLFELPHMLVAGSTGMGKSYFIRQMVLNLLENTPNLHVYAIDLKEGISMRPFKDLPNTVVVKELPEAYALLKKIRAEMKSRFKILEENEAEVIDFKKHKKDPILLVVDECSLLYAPSKVSDFKKEEADKAVGVTDEIAKLSRAAGIHLILGTQKISKETVSTHIQENIEGRVCFKVASVQGSAIVIGNKKAKDLPTVRGRAISKFSVDLDEVQTPLAETEVIKSRLKTVAGRFKGEDKLTRQDLVTQTEYETDEQENSIDKESDKSGGKGE